MFCLVFQPASSSSNTRRRMEKLRLNGVSAERLSSGVRLQGVKGRVHYCSLEGVEE